MWKYKGKKERSTKYGFFVAPAAASSLDWYMHKLQRMLTQRRNHSEGFYDICGESAQVHPRHEDWREKIVRNPMPLCAQITSSQIFFVMFFFSRNVNEARR